MKNRYEFNRKVYPLLDSCSISQAAEVLNIDESDYLTLKFSAESLTVEQAIKLQQAFDINFLQCLSD